MKFKTSITNIDVNGLETVRGHALGDLIQRKTFTESIFLVLRGRLPVPQEQKMMDALFTAVIDHGPATSSALCARISASAKNSMHTALAAGVLGFGDRHGVAVEAAMKFLVDHSDDADLPLLVKTMKEQKQYIAGFGHKVLSVDSRSAALFSVAHETGWYGKYCELIHTLHREINAISSKPLPINVDGAFAAILCDMGFDMRLGKGIFMIGRIPGLVAHIFEEMSDDQGIRRLEESEIQYMNN